MPTKTIGTISLPGARAGFLYDEWLPQLRGRPGAKKFREMADSDPLVGALLYAITMLIRQVEWRAEPYDKSGAAQDQADWLTDVLFRQMNDPFSDVIENACLQFIYGYSLLEIVYKPLPDGTIGIRELSPRPPESIHKWEYHRETLELLGAWQLRMDSAGDVALIPQNRLLHFRTSAARANPEGRSLLRNIYVPYERKKVLEISEGRLGVRAAGLVVMDIPDEYLDPNADEDKKAALASFVTQMEAVAKDRQGGMILPSGYHQNAGGGRRFDVRYVTADGQRAVDIDRMVQRYDQRIAVSVMGEFLLLGSGKAGSFALSSDKTDLFAMALGGFLDSMASVFNRQLLPRLWALNGWDPETRPKLVPGDIESPDLTALGAYVTALVGAGAPLFPNDKLTDYLLAAAKLPQPTPEERAEAEEQQRLAQEAAAANPFGADPEADPSEPPKKGAPKATKADPDDDDDVAARELAERHLKEKKKTGAVKKFLRSWLTDDEETD